MRYFEIDASARIYRISSSEDLEFLGEGGEWKKSTYSTAIFLKFSGLKELTEAEVLVKILTEGGTK